MEEKPEEDCVGVRVFKSGNEHEAEQLLQRTQAAVVMTTRFRLEVGLLVPALVSLLHAAAVHGWLNVVSVLTTKYNCDANSKDNQGRTPLHYAAYNGHLEVVRYFITKRRCHPMTTSNNGSTPLHLACANGQLDITQYLISELQCDLSTVNNKGSTPLHVACWNGHAHIVRYLLSTGKVNLLAMNMYGFTPVEYASISGNSYDILKLFHPFEQSKKDFPVHTVTKLILTGCSAAGKSTVAQLVFLLASNRASSDVAADCVAEVQRFTAGIIPIYIESSIEELSNMIVYDFAGQQEYYSSHAAVLEHVMQRSAAIFVCMVDLSQSKGEICESVQYWLSFVENACSTAEGTSHVVIVGSHADLVNCSQELEEKSCLVQKIANSRVKQLKYGGFVGMDCRRADTDDARRLISLLSNNQQAIAASQPSMSFYCHVLYAFLCTKLKKTGCMLQELTSALTAENDPSLPSDPALLAEFLIALSDKGVILFVKNKEHPLSSWVVVEKEVLLREVNGTLFAPEHFKEHCEISSNTGIVPITSLQKMFPQHSSEMLVGFLESMEFCQPVDSSVLQYTNLQTTPTQTTAEGLLFFPSLVQLERPYSLTQGDTLCFGWCLGCMDPHQFFSSRFFHVLLLYVAYTFPQSGRFNPASSPLRGLQRKCSVWRNGISWSDDDDITVVVELINKNRWVVVAMSCSKDRPVQHAKRRSALIGLVHHLQQERCPNLEVCEYLISPTLVQQYPFNDLPDTDLFDIRDVARSILRCKPSVRSCNKDCIGSLRTQSLSFEPYYLLSTSSVCQLFNSSMAEQPVPDQLLQEVSRHCHQPHLKPQDHKELREYVNGLSIFAGRNPLEVAELKEEDIISHTAHAPAASPSVPLGDPSRTLTIDDLRNVLHVTGSLVRWMDLGVELGLSYSTLAAIEVERCNRVYDCRRDMFAAWLQMRDKVSTVGEPSRSVLKDALRSIGEKDIADKM